MKETAMSDSRTYTVTGMTCGHCVSSVTEEVQEIPGVDNVEVVLETGALTVTSSQSLDDSAVRAAVEEAGYQLT
jgi:copper chaperone CopZ